ncbi:MAG TPA: hypothetical protein VKI64_01680 [Acidimicrobiales bacterium]|nr:hypothetical protein [Acidimicrobiales bacterium]
MSLVQPPPDAADDDPVLQDEGRVIDLPAGALSSRRTPRGRTTSNSRARRTVNGVDLGAALDASLADVSDAAEKLAGAGGVAPTAPRPAAPGPAVTPAPRPRAVPRPPAWQPVPWSEASARAAGRAAPSQPERRARMPQAAAPAAARQAPMPRQQPPVRTAITVPFPTQRARHEAPEDPARLRGVHVDPSVRTIPAWLLAVMVVAVAGVACLAAYLLLRP